MSIALGDFILVLLFVSGFDRGDAPNEMRLKAADERKSWNFRT